MEDVLDVYHRPYNKDYPVVCMDESSKQLTKETRIPISTKPGDIEKFDTEYERNGTCNIFLSYEPLKGWRNVEVTDRRTKVEWAHYIKKLVDVDYASAKKIVLVSDNLNTHNASSFYESFPPQVAKRVIVHRHSRWLDYSPKRAVLLATP